MAFFESLYISFMGLDYFWIIFIVSLVTTVITSLIYKYATNQEKLKKTKEEIKKLQEKLKKNKDDQKKMLEIQQEMMRKNMETMKQSFRPMIFTFIPLILLFSWMSATLAFMPLVPEQPYTVTAFLEDTYSGNLSDIKISSLPEQEIILDTDYVASKEGSKEVRWIITPIKEGTYSLVFEGKSFKETKEVLITSAKKYEQPVTEYKDSQLKKVVISNKPVKPFSGAPLVGGFSWLWAYVVLSIIMSIAIRKGLKIA